MLKVGHTLPPGGLLSYFFGVSYLLFARPPRGVGSVRSGKLPPRRRCGNFFWPFFPFSPHVLVIFPRVTFGRPPPGGMVTDLLFGGVTELLFRELLLPPRGVLSTGRVQNSLPPLLTEGLKPRFEGYYF